MEYITEISDGIPKIVCQELIEKFENDFIIDTNDEYIIGMTPSLDESHGWEVECTHIHEMLMKNLYKYIEMLKINIFEDKKNIIDEIFTGPKIVRTTFKIQKMKLLLIFALHLNGPIVPLSKVWCKAYLTWRVLHKMIFLASKL